MTRIARQKEEGGGIIKIPLRKGRASELTKSKLELPAPLDFKKAIGRKE